MNDDSPSRPDPSLAATRTSATWTGPRSTRPPPIETREEIGPYRLKSVLGEGGMGIVFLAEQTAPVRRMVALKVTRSLYVSDSTRRRFAAEREAMARLSHPAVGQIFDAGETEDGHLWFAMELVDGAPITDHCDQHRLGIRERLRLVVRVCAGVHHAHQKGLLHRDLKPSNILVTEIDGHPAPKIIDFGVVKALDGDLANATNETRESAVVGTPAYLSPEGIRGEDVDTRADVYSLGVLLFELLTGGPPHDPKTTPLLGLLRRVAEEEPPEPSSRVGTLDGASREAIAQRRMESPSLLSRRLAGDLDWIVVRALAREREDRYGSASDLAADLERHLRHEPVLASPPSRLYRLRKLIRRHRAVTAALGLVVVTSIGGFAARSIEAERARREAARAEHEAERAEREARAALDAQEEAEEVADFLVELFRVAEPGSTRGAEITAREILDRGAERVRGELDEQPRTSARLMATIGEVYRQLGLLEPALALQREALGVREREIGEDSLEVADSLRRVALVLDDAGDLPEAEDLYRRSLAIRERLEGPESLGVAEVLNNVAIAAILQGRREEAAEAFEKALDIREALLGSRDPSIAASSANLANVFAEMGRFERARELYLKAWALQLETLAPDHPHLAYTLHNLGHLELDLGDLDRAEELLQEALGIREKVLGEDHPLVARTAQLLGRTDLAGGDPTRAEEHLLRALDIAEAAYGPDALPLRETLVPLGRAQAALGRSADARATFARALALVEDTLGPDHVESAEVRAELGILALRAGRREAARSWLTGARDLFTDAGHEVPESLESALDELGDE